MGNLPDFCHNMTLVTNQTSYQDLSECWIERRIAEFLRINLPLIILPISLISNCLTFFALRSRHMRGTATAFFMVMLSVLDPLVLLTKNLVYYPMFIAAYPLFCKTLYFLIYVVGYTNVWILVIMTGDKFFAVWFPLQVAYFCTITRAKYVCILLLTVTGIISFHHFWTINSFKYPKDITKYACYYDMSRYAAIQRIWRYIDFVMWCFLPFILISSLSMLIICKLRQKRNDSRQNSQFAIGQNKGTSEVENGIRASTNRTVYIETEIRSTQKSKLMRSRQRHITFMLLAVVGVFLLFTLPNSIYFLLEITYGFNRPPTTNDYYEWLRYRRLTLLTVLMFQLSDLQHTANFFIYLLTSDKFRRSVISICLSIVYCFLALFTCPCRHRSDFMQRAATRFDAEPPSRTSRRSTTEMTTVLRYSRESPYKSQKQKSKRIYTTLLPKSNPNDLSHDQNNKVLL